MGYQVIEGTKFDYKYASGISEQFHADIAALGGWLGGSLALKLIDSSVQAGDMDIFCPDLESFFALKHFLWTHATFNGAMTDKELYVEFGMTRRQVQLVRPDLITSIIPDTPEDILDKVDFSVCRIMITSPNSMVIDEDLIDHLKDRKIVLRLEPECLPAVKKTIWRMSKYSSKGFVANKYDLLKLYSHIEEAPQGAMTALGRSRHSENENFICDESLEQMYDQFMTNCIARSHDEEEALKAEYKKLEEEWQSGNAQPWKGLA